MSPERALDYMMQQHPDGSIGVLEHSRLGSDCQYLRVKALPGMSQVIAYRLRLTGKSDVANAALSSALVSARALSLWWPTLFEWLMVYVLPCVAVLTDAVLWRAISAAARLAGKA